MRSYSSNPHSVNLVGDVPTAVNAFDVQTPEASVKVTIGLTQIQFDDDIAAQRPYEELETLNLAQVPIKLDEVARSRLMKPMVDVSEVGMLMRIRGYGHTSALIVAPPRQSPYLQLTIGHIAFCAHDRQAAMKLVGLFDTSRKLSADTFLKAFELPSPRLGHDPSVPRWANTSSCGIA